MVRPRGVQRPKGWGPTIERRLMRAQITYRGVLFLSAPLYVSPEAVRRRLARLGFAEVPRNPAYNALLHGAPAVEVVRDEEYWAPPWCLDLPRRVGDLRAFLTRLPAHVGDRCGVVYALGGHDAVWELVRGAITPNP